MILIFGLIFIRGILFENDRVEDFVGAIDHEQKLSVRFYFQLIYSQVIVIVYFRYTFINFFFLLLLGRPLK